jgi:pyrimidine operon attenuation protein/uracil phosphoribosyltransferase
LHLIGAAQVTSFVEAMARRLRAELAEERAGVLMVGIHTGGLWVAQRLHQRLGLGTPLGGLNISFYRDDFSARGLRPQTKPSQLPAQVSGRGIILVDDVLYTGRSVRAALNELFDYGRPRWVKLAVLVDRGGRELPISADVVGRRLELSPADHIKLRGPKPLALEIGAADSE